MQTNRKIFLTLLFLFCSVLIFAQDKKDEAKALLKQGTVLHDAGKYDEAIAKYDEALKIDPDNLTVVYEKAFTLASSGKPDLAIPYLEKSIAGNNEPAAYDLLGSIYDDKNDFEKATKYYTQGINAYPKYQRLRFNLSISYIRQKKYAEAEAQAIEAIKLDPKHASSQRAYALATFNQNKRDRSLLAWCSFLILEPQSKRSVEANNYIRYILNYGIKKTGEKSITLTVSDKDIGSSQMMMQMAVTTATDDKTGLTAVDSLTLQLKSVFEMLNESKTVVKPSFFLSYYAAFFGALAATNNMPAFTHYITLSAYHDDNIAWLKAHQTELNNFGSFVDTSKRAFE